MGSRNSTSISSSPPLVPQLLINNKNEEEALPFPSFIIATQICRYLSELDLKSVELTCKSLFSACEKAPRWEDLTRYAFEYDVKNHTGGNWRSCFLSLQKKYRIAHNRKYIAAIPANAIQVQLIGSPSVGKRSLVRSFLIQQVISREYNLPRVYMEERVVEVDIKVALDPPKYVANVIYIVVYSITNEDSFMRAKVFYNQVVRELGKQSSVILLVGNKIDLEDKRSVTTEEGQQLATDLGISFYEVSARNRVYTKKIFEEGVWSYAKLLYEQDIPEVTPSAAKSKGGIKGLLGIHKAKKK